MYQQSLVSNKKWGVPFMSEICLDCWNKKSNKKHSPKEFIISKELDLCEECGEYKPVIIAFREPFYIRIFFIFFLPFKILETIYDYCLVQFDFPNKYGKPYKSSGGKMVWNDINKGKDFSAMKKESAEDNQITDNEIWYLEYQTNDVNDNHYLNSNWRNEDLISDNLETAAKFTSREDAMNELQELYSVKKLPFPLKPITGLNMNECGVTCAGLGSAVQYVGNKKKFERKRFECSFSPLVRIR